MNISFDYYKVFYEVARSKNITLAASRMCLTQPTVSKYIQNLEHDLGCKLFDRSKKGVRLTPEGLLLFQQISRPCQQMDQAGNMVQEYVNNQSGRISIGTSELTMRYFLLPYLERFRHRFPNITIQIHAFTVPFTMSSLTAGTVDFALVITPLEDTKGIQVTEVTDFQDIVIAGNQMTQLQDQVLSLKDLTQYPIVCMEKGTPTRKLWDDIFNSQGMELHPNIEVNSNGLIPPTVLHNLGVGFVPFKFARAYLLNYGIIQLKLDTVIPKRHICIARNPSKVLPPATEALIQMLLEAHENPLLHHSIDHDLTF